MSDQVLHALIRHQWFEELAAWARTEQTVGHESKDGAVNQGGLGATQEELVVSQDIGNVPLHLQTRFHHGCPRERKKIGSETYI